MRNDSNPNEITYELPLNEAMRLCLSLESLFNRFDASAHARTSLDTRQAMQSLLKLLEVTDRPDIKSKLSQLLTQYTNTLTQLRTAANIDNSRLSETLTQLNQLSQSLHSTQHRFNEPLRQNDFLQHIRANAAHPSGITHFRQPDYHLWQQQSTDKKSQDFKNWIQPLDSLKHIIHSLLTITRDSGQFESAVAQDGFYHETFNPTHPYQLARVSLPMNHNVYPEFGAGKHRLTIRFLKPDYNGRPSQVREDLPFQISYCKL